INEGLMPEGGEASNFKPQASGKSQASTLKERQTGLPDSPAVDVTDRPGGSAETSDFYFIERDVPDRIADTLIEMVKRRIPAKFNLDPIRDIQVLSPMNRGSLGIRELNARLQDELNPRKAEEPFVEKFGWHYRIRDKVIQTENDYDKEVFNGDIGQIARIDTVE